MSEKIKKVLILGSGPITFGNGAERDASACSAAVAFKNEKIEVISLNSNPDSLLFDDYFSDISYLEPVNQTTIKTVIKKEQPNSIWVRSCGNRVFDIFCNLYGTGFFEEYPINILGISEKQFEFLSDHNVRENFFESENIKYNTSKSFYDFEDVLSFAEDVGYPIEILPSYTPVSYDKIVVYNKRELKKAFDIQKKKSTVEEVSISKCVDAFSYIEFVILRDVFGKTKYISSIESFDEKGISSGDSIRVIPAQSISENQKETFLKISEEIAEKLDVVGSFSVGFAFEKDTEEYYITYVNPLMNRDTAFVEKATGVNLSYISAKISLGFALDEIDGILTDEIDYCAVKLPKWSFDNFEKASRKINDKVKSTGECLGIGKCIETALLKGIRSVNVKYNSFSLPKITDMTDTELKRHLSDSDDNRLFMAYEALKRGYDKSLIKEKTRFTESFINILKNIAETENKIKDGMSEKEYIYFKEYGFLDKIIEKVADCEVKFSYQNKYNTSEGNNIFYYADKDGLDFIEDKCKNKRKILVVGSGPSKIGLGTDRDYVCFKVLKTLKENGYTVIFVNNNPLSITTDRKYSDKIYFESQTEEDILNIVRIEKPEYALMLCGGNRAVSISNEIEYFGVKVLGASQKTHEIFENKIALYDFCNENNIPYANRKMLNKGSTYEVEALSDGNNNKILGILEYVENSAVNPENSTAVIPPIKLSDKLYEKLCEYSGCFIKKLGIIGFVNLEFLLFNDKLYLKSASDVSTKNIPILERVRRCELSKFMTEILLGKKVEDFDELDCSLNECFVKQPVFSFENLLGEDLVLGKVQKATGKVLGRGVNFETAFLKAMSSASNSIKRIGGVLISVADTDKRNAVVLADKFQRLGFKIYATEKTAAVLVSEHIPANAVKKVCDGSPNTMDLILSGKIKYLISTSDKDNKVSSEEISIRRIAMLKKIPVFTSVDSALIFLKTLNKSGKLYQTEL
ncbi:MAG: ATP-binding protein [Candidatus Fimenecus sp.]